MEVLRCPVGTVRSTAHRSLAKLRVLVPELGPEGPAEPAEQVQPLSYTQRVVYFLSPTGKLSGLDLRTGDQVWRGHAGTGRPEPGPNFWDIPQLLLYEDVLVAGHGSTLVSLLPRIDD